ncbi:MULTISPECIES: enoyl-CoA hydratase-related protein [Rhodococcus]|uniref:Enoyl-CoA hydratase-related protein n=1 Tax=Rhodococcus oxybenzonivorans TaxID=1990687 RepID=A0AAE4UZ55_9NOCA|nr:MULTISPECIES: enoyl-CoA hydratase-related protein [Rhodococcus]MDV7241866.1 enoyl-CoA hydratase-related protein [Rhodococcus oxybenzonivorans]MDV7265480.1 enoyl-CoA hydratase-related protein [Rhodococcus oxybenzonivorans]MDV7273600.1 enoyl-CoA hydratase-related protein [Rhodococcus oxybenzonivorans]MDV7334148.1 enoyl-CoA hydratase-related protein [Rhodococcus oxybenzonivorans]MDV7343567.1 enoyl-CoA hydratase-related protein [Rhodococcus oxybenzonivorans]
MTPVNGISIERRGAIAVVWLDHPDRGNGFISDMQVELHEQLVALDSDHEVRAIVVTGRGRFFSTGADMEPGGANFAFDAEQTARARRMMRDRPRPWKLRTPVIAAMNGSAVGLGLTFALQWDIRVVNESAKYGFVFPRRGLIPEQNSLWLLPKLVGLSTAVELLLTGRLFSGAEARDLGIAARAVPGDQVLDTAVTIANEIADNTSAAAVGLTKELVYSLLEETDREAAFHLEWENFRAIGRESDATEGVAAFIEKRPPHFTLDKRYSVDVAASSEWEG